MAKRAEKAEIRCEEQRSAWTQLSCIDPHPDDRFPGSGSPVAPVHQAMSADRRLRDYRKKRDLRRSSEPRGGKRRNQRKPIFVIQQHSATQVHFDFRLESSGVLKSWAVAKGPSTDPREKRLAIEVEDHPLDYADFEGTIPEGEYGAGTVIVWDRGTFKNITHKDGDEVSLETGLKEGHVAVRLAGKKLEGGYALTRIRSGRKPRWLLVKMRDEAADARRNPVNTEPGSVKSGRTLKEVTDKENE